MKNLMLTYSTVIFASKRSFGDNRYSLMVEKIKKLAKVQKGYLGLEYAFKVFHISSSKKNDVHALAQQKRATKWCDSYSIKICKVKR